MMKRAVCCVLACFSLFLSCSGGPEPDPLYLGILLPLGDENNPGWEDTLDWIKASINENGGVAGRPLEYLYYDTAGDQTREQVNRLISENRVAAVVGPDSSSAAFAAAPKFIKARIPFFTVASSGALFKAYRGSGYVWRTVESDVAQVQTMLLIAKRQNYRRVSLLVNDNEYGETFFDWFGFFATELGFEVGDVVKAKMQADDFSSYCQAAVENAPEILFVVPSTAREGVCIARYLRAHHPEIQLFFSDTGMAPYYLSELGEQADGLEGVTYGYDPASGFAVAYRVLFGGEPPALSANLYDSVMMLAFALELSGGAGGESLSAAIGRLVDGRGEKTGWDSFEIGRTLNLIRGGESPDISGTTGGLEFDQQYYTDPLATTYAHWRVESGEYIVTEYFFTGQDTPFNRSESTSAVYQTFASNEQRQRFEDSGITPELKSQTGTWALVASVSSGWENYRHQADALAQYDLLKRNGIPDDRIILVLTDDLAQNTLNPEPGTVRNQPGGDNLYQSPEIDYRPGDISAGDLLDILAGADTPEHPAVIQSTDSDNVYVFIIGHGGSEGVCMGECGEYISPEDLQAAVARMSAEARFRQLLIVVEACHGGVMGTGISEPSVMLISGANPYENSMATNYDSDLDAWISDEFAFAYYSAIQSENTPTLLNLYQQVYLQVPGSHVTVYNAENFGDLSEVNIAEFLSY